MAASESEVARVVSKHVSAQVSHLHASLRSSLVPRAIHTATDRVWCLCMRDGDLHSRWEVRLDEAESCEQEALRTCRQVCKDFERIWSQGALVVAYVSSRADGVSPDYGCGCPFIGRVHHLLAQEVAAAARFFGQCEGRW